jgi:outer membrane protein
MTIDLNSWEITWKFYLCNHSNQMEMKNTLLNTGLAVLFSTALISCNSNGTATTASSKDSLSTNSNVSNEIVYVNSDSLLHNYEYFKDVTARFESKTKAAQADLTAKGTAFQREVAEYQGAAGNMSAEQRAATEERLARKQEELGRLNQNASTSLGQEEAEENEKLYNKISDYLKKFSADKGYKLVLTYSTANPTVLYADKSLEVTKEVVDGLNAEYEKEKK